MTFFLLWNVKRDNLKNVNTVLLHLIESGWCQAPKVTQKHLKSIIKVVQTIHVGLLFSKVYLSHTMVLIEDF